MNQSVMSDYDDEIIELRRSPGHCCPEPSCDYLSFNYSQCKMCGRSCRGCVHDKPGKRRWIR